MHAIALAIAGSLRISTAPTGSRLLPPPRFLPPRLDAQLTGSRGRRSGGALFSCGVTSSAAGQRGGYPAPSLSHLGRSAGVTRMAVTSPGSPGGQSSWQCGSMRKPTRSLLQGRQSSRGSTRWRPACNGPLQTSSSRSVEQWPLLPMGGWSSCGSTQWLTSGRRLAGSTVQTAGLRCGGPFASSHSASLVIQVVRSGDGLDSPGRVVQLQDAVAHPES
jgi:hypothetical protein